MNVGFPLARVCLGRRRLPEAIDPYVHGGEPQAAPASFRARLRQLGPGIVVSGAVVGSGEILLTSNLGAQAGFVMLWWVLLSCWSKSIVQAELARYVITTGDTYLRALNRLPGRIPGPGGPIAWPIVLSLVGVVTAVMGLGGIMGGAGQALELLTGWNSLLNTGLVALATSAILGIGAYLRLERAMMALVISFTIITLICAILMQFTPYAISAADLAAGFEFQFPIEYAVVALAMYGYTGVNSSENAAYTYWCIEKGWPARVGHDPEDPAWASRARDWLRVMHLDVWTTLGILTLATLPFYLLGAGVLHGTGAAPEGLDTLRVLSAMFTDVLGGWSLWLFGLGAFFIFFSTVLSGISAGSRILPDYLVELGLLDRRQANRRPWIRGFVLLLPALGFLLYLTSQSPVLLVSIGAITAALFLPIQSGAALWLQGHIPDPRVRPGRLAHTTLQAVFLFQMAMAGAVIYLVVI